jgi:hypothetical protein
MMFIRGQEFIDAHGMVFRITAASTKIVMLERQGELPAVVARHTQMRPEDLERNIRVAGWKLLK